MAQIDNLQNGSTTILASAARTATPTISDQWRTPVGCTGLLLIVDVTAVTSTPSTVFTILGYDPVSAKSFTLLASAAIATTQTLVLRVSPHLAAAANTIAKDVIPTWFTVTAVHGNANSMTYSVSFQAV